MSELTSLTKLHQHSHFCHRGNFIYSMLALVRTAPKRISRPANGRPIIRALADVVATLPNKSIINPPPVPRNPTPTQRSIYVLSKERIPTREDHGLYAFFRRKEDVDLVGDARFEVVETPEKVQGVTGRYFATSSHVQH